MIRLIGQFHSLTFPAPDRQVLVQMPSVALISCVSQLGLSRINRKLARHITDDNIHICE
jgi:hypothetical protein